MDLSKLFFIKTDLDSESEEQNWIKNDDGTLTGWGLYGNTSDTGTFVDLS